MSYHLSADAIRRSRVSFWSIARLGVVSGAVGCAALAMVAGSLSAPSYRASAQLEFVQAPGSPPLSDAARDARIDSIVATAESTEMVEQLLRPMSLEDDPTLRREAVGRFGRAEQRAVAMVLLDHLRAEREGATNLIRIETEGDDPAWAARIANGVAGALITRSLADRLASVTVTRATDDDLAERSHRADRADADLAAFQARAETVDDGQEIAALRGALSLARGESAVAHVRAAAAEQAVVVPGGSAAIGINSLADLRTAQAAAQRRMAELDERYSSAYPLVINTRTELASADRAVATEIDRLRRTADADARGASARATALSGGLASARARRAAAILDSATLARLQRAADEAKEAYRQLVASRVQQTTDRALAVPELRLVARAVPPLRPISPNRTLLALVGGLAGGAAGLAFARWWTRRSLLRPIAAQ